MGSCYIEKGIKKGLKRVWPFRKRSEALYERVKITLGWSRSPLI